LREQFFEASDRIGDEQFEFWGISALHSFLRNFDMEGKRPDLIFCQARVALGASTIEANLGFS